MMRGLSLLLLLLFTTSAYGYEQDDVWGYLSDEAVALPHTQNQKDPAANLLDGERIQKFERVLGEMSLPLESPVDFQALKLPEPDELYEPAIAAMFKWMDPAGAIRRYLNFTVTSLSLFDDFFSGILPDRYRVYTTQFKNLTAPQDSRPLIQRLDAISVQRASPYSAAPLLDLKVLIDPGHMGTELWDAYTGKFVEIGKRKRKSCISEGEINLHTALLLAQRLEGLGAIVQLTRTDYTPASKVPLEQYNPAHDIAEYFYASLDDWLMKYLHLDPPELFQKIKSAPETKKIFSTQERVNLFITREDLRARYEMIDSFQPDITIDIHHDATDTTKVQNQVNFLEAYVPGAFMATEAGSKSSRALGLKHLLEVRRWQESVNLAASVIQAMTRMTGVPARKLSEFGSSIRVKEGVYARNLAITRRATHGLVMYLECFRYDYEPEFRRLLNRDRSLNYRGVSFDYSSRHESVVDGIVAGMLDYFQNRSL